MLGGNFVLHCKIIFWEKWRDSGSPHGDNEPLENEGGCEQTSLEGGEGQRQNRDESVAWLAQHVSCGKILFSEKF